MTTTRSRSRRRAASRIYHVQGRGCKEGGSAKAEVVAEVETPRPRASRWTLGAFLRNFTERVFEVDKVTRG